MSEGRREVEELRAQMAELDRGLLGQLEARARLSHRVRELAVAGGGVAAPADLRVTLEDLERSMTGDLPLPGVRAVFQAIAASARAIEQPLDVAYLGPEGGFAHRVALGYFGDPGRLIEVGSAAEAIEAVTRGRAEHAVVPFESSEDGLVQSTLGPLGRSSLVLVAERVCAWVYHLVNVTGNLGDVDKIYATPVARGTCERLLTVDLARAPVIDVRSPLVAAQLCRGDHGSAALVPAHVAAESGLAVARANVGDAPDLRLRYAVIGNQPPPRSGLDASCLLFSVDDTPGALFSVLRHFAERGVNLRKLQSRPSQGEGWDYVFFVEVSGHVTDRPVVTALEAVKRTAKYLRVLGSFPVEA